MVKFANTKCIIYKTNISNVCGRYVWFRNVRFCSNWNCEKCVLFCRQEFCCFCERGEGALAGKIGSSQHLVNLATFGQFGNIWSIWQHFFQSGNICSIWQLCPSFASLHCLKPVWRSHQPQANCPIEMSAAAPTNTDFPLSLELPTHQQAARQRGLKLECSQINLHLCLLEPNGKVALKMKHCQTPRMFYTSCCKMVEAYTS